MEKMLVIRVHLNLTRSEPEMTGTAAPEFDPNKNLGHLG